MKLKKILLSSIVIILSLTKLLAQSGEVCYISPTKPGIVNARILYTINTAANTLNLRVIFSKTFVDNTFGTTAIGWGTKGHKFGDLVGSDHVQLAIYDATNVKRLEFKLDYFSTSTAAPSGYKSLGVLGGDGKMILGSSADVLFAKTAMDANFNDFGYSSYTINSPATDTSYRANTATPNWIYDVWYETTVRLSTLGTAGFGRIEIPSVHASPSKTGNNTEIVIIGECPKVLKLGNLVFKDVNNNGVKDTNEPGVSNATVRLYRDRDMNNIPDSAALATTITNSNGNYLFSSLSTGSYIVGVSIPLGLSAGPTTSTSSNPNNDIDNDNNGVSVLSGELRSNYISLAASTEPFNDGDDNNGNLTLDFGLIDPPAVLALGNLVWLDINGNNVKDATEPLIPNATVKLYVDANNDNIPDGAAIATTITNSLGIYGFNNLAAGNYVVGVVIPANMQARLNGTVDPDNNIDNDNNGVNLTGFNVPGNEVRSNAITLQSGSEPTNDGDDANGNQSLDFGMCPLTNNLVLGNLVWLDTNGNNIKDATEPVIPNATVKLYVDANNDNIPDGAAIATTITNSLGIYRFNNLAAGNYIAGVVIPANMQARLNGNIDPDNNIDNDNNGVTVVGSNLPGSEVRSNTITLSQGTEPINDGDDSNGNLTLDFGMCPFTPVVKLGNQIFVDLNGNGVRDLNEPGVPGTTVNLYLDANGDNSPDGVAISSTITGSDGTYYFSNIAPGNYIIGVDIPFGYLFIGPGNPLPNNDIDNDNNGVRQVGNEVRTNFIVLTYGGEPTNDGDDNNSNLTLDVGLIINANCKIVNGKIVTKLDNGSEVTNNLVVYPNPARSGFTVNVSAEIAQTTEIYIYDLNGKLISSKKVKVTPGVNTIFYNNGKTFMPGQYIIKTNIANTILAKKIVIEK